MVLYTPSGTSATDAQIEQAEKLIEEFVENTQLRDEFAKAALSALAGYVIQPDGGTAPELAKMCYGVADAFLAERAKGGAK